MEETSPAVAYIFATSHSTAQNPGHVTWEYPYDSAHTLSSYHQINQVIKYYFAVFE